MAARSRGRLTILFLWVVVSLTAFSQQAVDPRTIFVPPQQPPTTTVPDLKWLRLDQARALLERLRLGASVSGPEEQFVMDQDPAPGTEVKAGTVVTIAMGQPELRLLASATTAEIDQELKFELVFVPPMPEDRRHPARYLFEWDDA